MVLRRLPSRAAGPGVQPRLPYSPAPRRAGRRLGGRPPGTGRRAGRAPQQSGGRSTQPGRSSADRVTVADREPRPTGEEQRTLG